MEAQNGWTEIEQLPILTLENDPNDETRIAHGVGLIDHGIPPADFAPSIGVWYYPPDREQGPTWWVGGPPPPPGSKFMVPGAKVKRVTC